MEMPLSKNIKITYSGDDNVEAKATSSDTNIVTVNAQNHGGSGEVIVKPNMIGNAVVTVKMEETTNYKEAVATCNIEVIKKLRVYFDTQDGNEKYSKLVTYNRAYGELETPTERKGYEFIGWYTEKTGGTRVESTTIVNKTEVHTLYARWQQILNQ